MTYEERTNLESYLRNIHNLVELKNALQYSLDDASCELYDAVDRLGIETGIKDTIYVPNDYEGVNDYFNQTYTKTMTRVLERILPCWKLIEK